jgi:hypothetical protein
MAGEEQKGKFLLHSSFSVATAGGEQTLPQSKAGSNGWNAVELLLAVSPSSSEGSLSEMDQSYGVGGRCGRLRGSTAKISSMSCCNRCHS